MPLGAAQVPRAPAGISSAASSRIEASPEAGQGGPARLLEKLTGLREGDDDDEVRKAMLGVFGEPTAGGRRRHGRAQSHGAWKRIEGDLDRVTAAADDSVCRFDRAPVAKRDLAKKPQQPGKRLADYFASHAMTGEIAASDPALAWEIFRHALEGFRRLGSGRQ